MQQHFAPLHATRMENHLWRSERAFDDGRSNSAVARGGMGSPLIHKSPDLFDMRAALALQALLHGASAVACLLPLSGFSAITDGTVHRITLGSLSIGGLRCRSVHDREHHINTSVVDGLRSTEQSDGQVSAQLRIGSYRSNSWTAQSSSSTGYIHRLSSRRI